MTLHFQKPLSYSLTVSGQAFEFPARCLCVVAGSAVDVPLSICVAFSGGGAIDL